MKLKANAYAYIVILAGMLLVAGVSLRMRYFETKVMPILLATIIFVLAAIGLAREILPGSKLKSADAEVGQRKTGGKRRWGYLLHGGWIAGFALGIYLLGFFIAVPLFLLFYMRYLGTRWRVAALFAALTPALLYGLFIVALQTELYRGAVYSWLGY